MKTINKYSFLLVMALIAGMFTACSDFEPTGYQEVPTLAKAMDLKADISGYNVNLSWTLPAGAGIENVLVYANNYNEPVRLSGNATSYTFVGQAMEQEYIYTVKLAYSGGYVSEGVSVRAEIPHVDLPEISNLTAEVNGRAVTLSWTLPQASGITAVKIYKPGEEDAATVLDGTPTTFTLRGQPMGQEVTYTVALVYENYYASAGKTISAAIPYITPKMGYLMTAANIAELPDDDERAAASWFITQENAELIQPSQLADLDPDLYPVLWIEIDRVGLPFGWENLPSEIVNENTLNALRDYSARGGNLFLANMATQLTVPLGFVPDNMAPTVFGNGDGGTGDDVWVINPYLGWDFRNGSDQGFYDRTAHAIYQGLTLEDPNGYGYANLPLIGPGQREDHNCLWDCNIYGKGNYPDVIRNFEVTTNSMVLATWGHVRDHCVAGMVEFYATAQHGRCIANGLAAYEWNQNSGTNPYQGNIEQLTKNILDYLK